MNRAIRSCWAAAAIVLALSAPARAQDANVGFPVQEVERKLKSGSFTIADMRGSRWEQDRTQRVALQFEDSTMMLIKWAKAAAGGETFNNVPRYEVAAYELQKLFLEEADYVVPPTVLRVMSLDYYRTLDPRIKSTFGKLDGVIVVLQYWLSQVVPSGVFDEARAGRDERYAYHLGNANVFSYLVRHSDSNQGNFLISTDSANPRIFAVDNGVAFLSMEGDRGTEWRELRVKRLPAATVERLKALTKEDLQRALGVLAEFEIQAGKLVEAAPGPNLDPKKGVRRTDTRVQFGLKDAEIDDVYRRLQRLGQMVDRGSIKTF